jgi:hypothetical protein
MNILVLLYALLLIPRVVVMCKVWLHLHSYNVVQEIQEIVWQLQRTSPDRNGGHS